MYRPEQTHQLPPQVWPRDPETKRLPGRHRASIMGPTALGRQARVNVDDHFTLALQRGPHGYWRCARSIGGAPPGEPKARYPRAQQYPVPGAKRESPGTQLGDPYGQSIADILRDSIKAHRTE